MSTLNELNNEKTIQQIIRGEPMTAGYYKNHVDYNKHGTYGRNVSYGRHIDYNKPSDSVACNYTTYSDGSKVPFDGDVPATGDIYSTITLELIGYRDPVTFVFTPEPVGFADISQFILQNIDNGSYGDFTDSDQFLLRNTGYEHSGAVNILQDVLFFADGQSNMQGKAQVQNISVPSNVRVWDWSIQEFIPFDPLDPASWDSTEIGEGQNPAHFFMRDYALDNPDKMINVVLNAIGGKGIDQWVNSASMYIQAVTEIPIALSKLNTDEVEGMLWIQGENDNHRTNDLYRDDLNSVFADYRAESWAVTEMPIMLGKLMDNFGNQNTVIQEFAVDGYNYNIVAQVDPLANIDGVHYNSTQNENTGADWYTGYKNNRDMGV